MLVVVIVRVLTGQGGVTQTGLEERIQLQQRQVEQLEYSVAQLRSPQRIADRAAQLGLVTPGHVVYLSPTPAAGTSAAAPSTAASPGRAGR